MSIQDDIRMYLSDVTSAAYLLTDARINVGLLNAISIYSTYRPHTMSATAIASAAIREYDLPGDFDIYFSEIDKIVYPATSSLAKQDISYLADTVWLIPDETSPKLRFNQDLEDGYKYKIFYTITQLSSTLPSIDQLSVAEYAAGVCLLQIAAKFARTDDPTLGIEVANYRSKAKEYAYLANQLKKSARRYWDLQIGRGKARGEYGVVDDVGKRSAMSDRTRMTGDFPGDATW